MTKRGRTLLVVTLVAATLVAGVAAVRVSLSVLAEMGRASEKSCAASAKAGEEKVRTDRWDSPDDLPGLGEYVEIHWQVRAPGNPCSRVPGPTDRRYQGVVRLRPEDARALATRHDWRPRTTSSPSPDSGILDTPAQAWPSLAPLVPAEARWLHSESYNQQAPEIRWRNVYLDPDRALVFFALYDH